MAGRKSVLVYECISGGGMEAIAAGEPELLAQGVAMRDALVADLARAGCWAVSCAVGARAPLPASLGSVRPLAGTERTPQEFLALHASRHDAVWVIAPESEGLLSVLAETVGPARWVGCSAPAIRLATSKTATRRLLAANGIPTPLSWRPGEPAPAPESRWVVKPDDGVGATGAVVHAGFASARADLETRRSAGFASAMEAWVEGSPMSLSLLCGRGRARVLAINRQYIALEPDGAVAYEGVEIAAEPLDSPRGLALTALARDIAGAVPGLAGYVGVDLVWHARRGPIVIEINPRLTCSYAGLSEALRENVAASVMREFEEEAEADVAC